MNISGYNYYFDIAATAIFLVILLHFIAKRRIRDEKHYVFFSLIVTAIMVPVLDIPSAMLIDRLADPVITYLITTLYYIAKEATNFLFLYYVIVQLEMGQRVVGLKRFCLFIPILVAFVLTLTNHWTGYLFTYSVQDGYHSGPLRYFTYFLTVLYYAWAFFYVTIKQDIFGKRFIYIVYEFCVINIIGTIIQFSVSNVLLISFSFSLGLIPIFVYEDEINSTVDVETGIATRSLLMESVRKRIYNSYPFHSVAVRLKDYDLLAASYGIDNVENLVNEIGRFLTTHTQYGSTYKFSDSTFVLNYPGKNDPMKLQKDIYRDLDKVWKINEMEIACTFLVTILSYPDKIRNIDDYMSNLYYFQNLDNSSGIIPLEVLQVRDHQREQQIIEALKRAFDNRGFTIHYQPICTSDTIEFITAEALVRLTDSQLGPISPAEFIPVAEEQGQILAIGEFVFESVCEFVQTHDMEALGLKYIELNLSTVQCLQSDFLKKIDDVINKYGVDPKYLSLEITETASNLSPDIFVENLKGLRERGFSLVLDDFGSGYGNIERLVSSSFDIVKFDRNLTTRLTSEDNLRAMFATLQNMFHSMGSKVVAEGVENKEQVDFLNSIGCDYIQGFYFSRPLPTNEFIEFIEEHKRFRDSY